MKMHKETELRLLSKITKEVEEFLGDGNVIPVSINETIYFMPFVFKRVGETWCVASVIKFPADWTNEQHGEAWEKVLKEPTSLKYTVE